MANINLEIRNKYHKMSATQKVIADFVLKYQDDFIEMTSVEIAEKTNVSSASVVRFVRFLGYDGLESFKRELAVASRSEIDGIDPIISPKDSIDDISKKVNSIIVHGVQELFEDIDLNELEVSISKVKSAKKIFIFGIGASSLPAYDLYHKLNRINKTTYFDFDNHMTMEFLHYATEEDVVILFSYSGASKEVVYPAEYSKEKGTTTIAVTHDPQSDLGRMCDHLLKVPNTEGVVRVGALTSKINSMVIADLLYLGLISPELEKIEKDFISTSAITQRFKVKEQ